MVKLSGVTILVKWVGALSCLVSVVCADALSDNLVGVYKTLFRPSGPSSDAGRATDDTDMFSLTPDFVTKYGYPIETHTVTTEDGYLLTVYRIPGSPKASSAGAGTPVLVQHGLFGSSDHWVLTGPDRGLSFLLADQGYDVWLSNARGNQYSRSHTTLSPEGPSFWNFTWHEMGVYDLPAVVDYILATTNHKQIFYIGHSMGTTIFFVLTSTRPEYNDKIKLMVALAPVAYFSNKTDSKLVNLLLPYRLSLYNSLKKAGVNELFPHNRRIYRLLYTLCKEGQLTQVFCSRAVSLVFGNNPSQLNKTLIPLYITRSIAGASLNTLFHYFQAVQTGRFQGFDHTTQAESVLEEYDVSQITCPVSLVYALNDLLVDPEDVFKLSRLVPNVVQLHQLNDSRASHLDFIYANDVKTMVYDQVLDMLQKHSDSSGK